MSDLIDLPSVSTAEPNRMANMCLATAVLFFTEAASLTWCLAFAFEEVGVVPKA